MEILVFLVRAYVYILSLGNKGLKDIALYAVLNANYLKYLLSSNYEIPFSDGTLHEFVISAVKQKDRGAKSTRHRKVFTRLWISCSNCLFSNKYKRNLL